MKITTISYEALYNLGNYENEKIRLSAELAEDESCQAALAELRQRAYKSSKKLEQDARTAMRTVVSWYKTKEQIDADHEVIALYLGISVAEAQEKYPAKKEPEKADKKHFGDVADEDSGEPDEEIADKEDDLREPAKEDVHDGLAF